MVLFFLVVFLNQIWIVMNGTGIDGDGDLLR